MLSLVTRGGVGHRREHRHHLSRVNEVSLEVLPCKRNAPEGRVPLPNSSRISRLRSVQLRNASETCAKSIMNADCVC